ncbi:uncharacterized protein LY89DRAFT_687362 [Mollisia scopiformis]|uniref:Uncharacterized protein n=1 Tax=Mollisia scopiformis TaxID=149040 RepID=A0A194X2P9_MOLSC|nr:uncharacterized protein LY89DRAFT_687362 [Mollisia scopiformis]KUJ14112.1 hypothetical protein LY89DRAFT_687362 [Mollisia scopiformis]
MPSSSSQQTLPVVHAKLSTQMGILFGFVAIFIVILISYSTVWWLYNKREERQEAQRKQDLIDRGFGPSGYSDEKKNIPAHGQGADI